MHGPHGADRIIGVQNMTTTLATPTAPAALLTVRQAAQTLGLSERKVWNLTSSGALPAIRFGRAVRYHPEDIAKLCDRQRVAH